MEAVAMRKISAERAFKILKFDESLMETKYPGKSHSISFPSKLRTELMKDADHNARKIGSVVRAILNFHYFKGGSSGKGTSFGGGRVDLGADIKKAVYGVSKEEKKKAKIKAAMANELSSILEKRKENVNKRIGSDDERLLMIELERQDAERQLKDLEKEE